MVQKGRLPRGAAPLSEHERVVRNMLPVNPFQQRVKVVLLIRLPKANFLELAKVLSVRNHRCGVGPLQSEPGEPRLQSSLGISGRNCGLQIWWLLPPVARKLVGALVMN